MPVNPVDFLFGSYRREVLGLLLLRPEDGLHVREISRLTGVPAGSLHRELRALTDAGLLQRESVGNQVRYRANRDCPIYPELAAIFRKQSEQPDLATQEAGSRASTGARSDTAPERHAPPTLHSPQAAYAPQGLRSSNKLRIAPARLEALCRKYGIARLSVFGSAARNELTPESDVDLMVEFAPDSHASLFDLATMQDEFSAALGGRKVDIATPEILQNPFRRESIERDLKPIYEA